MCKQNLYSPWLYLYRMEKTYALYEMEKTTLFYIWFILENGIKKPLNFDAILYPSILYKIIIISLDIAVFFFGIISFKIGISIGNSEYIFAFNIYIYNYG